VAAHPNLYGGHEKRTFARPFRRGRCTIGPRARLVSVASAVAIRELTAIV
jgi:hypothetical protein